MYGFIVVRLERYCERSAHNDHLCVSTVSSIIHVDCLWGIIRILYNTQSYHVRVGRKFVHRDAITKNATSESSTTSPKSTTATVGTETPKSDTNHS